MRCCYYSHSGDFYTLFLDSYELLGIKQSIERIITQKEASGIIGISERQIRRFIKKIREGGDIGIVHKARDKPGHRKIDNKTRGKVIKLYDRKYWDFGSCVNNFL